MLKAHHHLTRDQRCQIFALKRRGLTQTGIAVDVGVSQGTVSRELARNKGFRGYRFLQAHRFAEQRGSARKGLAHVMTPCLIVRVETFCTRTSGVLSKFAVHSTTKTAQKLVMRASIGTSGQTSAWAERCISICANVAISAISVVPRRRGVV
jgi:IS30 family transposase